MVDRPIQPPHFDVDLSDLGKTMLAAAQAAHIGVSMSLLDPEPRTIYVNQAAADILGWSSEELLAEDLMGHVAPEDLPRLRDRLQQRIGGQTGEASYEISAFRRDGARS